MKILFTVCASLLKEAILASENGFRGDIDDMNTVNLAIALATLLAVSAIIQPAGAEYWIISDDMGMPTVTDKRPADMVAGVQGPFKYYDQAVRAMGTGTEWRSRCYITGLCTNAKHIGK